MSHIYVNQVGFEYQESNSYHDILVNAGSGSHLLGEQIVSPSHIYVNWVNFELPVSAVNAEVIVNSGLGTHTLEESIAGTPVVEPEVAVGGGASQRIRVLGGRPYVKDVLTSVASNTDEITEETYIHEALEIYARGRHNIDATIRTPVYRKAREIEVRSFKLAKDRSIISTAPIDVGMEQRQKQEEEMLLLGII